MKNKYVTIFAVSVLIGLLTCNNSYAGEKMPDQIQESMYSQLGNSNVGMEYFLTFHPASISGSANAFKIYVSSEYETEVTLYLPWGNDSITKMTKKRDVIEFSLTPEQVLCYMKMPNEKPISRDTFNLGAIHLKAKAPIVVYAVAELDQQSGGYLALPVNVLGKEYVVASSANGTSSGSSHMPGYASIVIPYDSTDIEVSTSSGDIIKYLNRKKRDIVLLSAKDENEDLSGTLIKSTKPVAVISGNYCTYNPKQSICDYTIEMETPMYGWGKAYPVYPIQGNSGYMLKVFTSERAAKIFKDKVQIAQIPEKFGSEAIGFIVRQLTNEPTVISSDKNINVVQYNIDSAKPVMPFQMNIVSSAHFQEEAYFSTPGLSKNSYYTEHNINIIYSANSDGTLPDDIVISDVEQGSYEWKSVKLSELSPGPGTKFPSSVNGDDNYYTKSVKIDGGVYKLASDKPFALYSYGYSGTSSYGFPASIMLNDSIPDNLPPVPAWTLKCNGSVTDGIVTDTTNHPGSYSNMGCIIPIAHQTENYIFHFSNFYPGLDRTASWTLEVKDITADAKITIQFTDFNGNDTIITINYYAPKLSVSPPKVDFGIVKAGETIDKEVTVTNNSPTSTFFLTKVNVLTDRNGFSIKNPKDSIVIKPKSSVKIIIEYRNYLAGDFSDSLGIGNDCIFSYRTQLTARSLKPAIKVTDIDYGEVIKGNKVTKDFWIYNKGAVNLKITDTTGNINKAFTPVFEDITFNQYKPLVIKPGDSLRLKASFNPTEEAYFEDSIIFSSDADGLDSVVVLKGYGVQPGLTIAGIDFGNCRVFRSNFPYPGQIKAKIKIENESAMTLRIDSITTTMITGNSSAFTLPFDFMIKELKPAASFEGIVQFHPEATGDYKMEIAVTYTGGNVKKTYITGRGVLPRIALLDSKTGTNVIDFGEAPVMNSTPVLREIKLYNEPWEFSDSLTISDFEVQSIDTNGRQNGTKGFFFDKKATAIPKTLQPGDTLAFNAGFIAPEVGKDSALLKVVSDAENGLVLELTGVGLEPNLAIESNSANTCLGESDTINCIITNTGNVNSMINDIEFKDSQSVFSLCNTFEPFEIGPMESKQVKIAYNPGVVGHDQDLITINALFSGKEKLFTHTIKAESYQYSLISGIYPDTNLINIDVEDVEFNIVKSITVSGIDDLSAHKVNEIGVEVNYNGSYLLLNEEDIKIGNSLDGIFEVSDININNIDGKVTFRITANTNNKYFSGKGEIAQLVFHIFHPTGNDTNRKIEHSINLQSECITFSDHKSSIIDFTPGCYNPDSHRVNFTKGNFLLENIWPNPAVDNTVKLKFSIPLKCYTEVRIYNSMGRLMAVPIKKVLQYGGYEYEIDLSGLNSGVYWFLLTSGKYSATNKIVISK